ncbi:DUF3846 domain-containing protein [Streptomyces sp. NBC_01381]|uniref:DUF3846 domain-containing protein n=1 Tax=Streptomyces sp. NBC_01381 TaxID=2903845 RepID=UPI00225C2066|nr:DUF3846 domain-containing protein [Streptomyces sp. NBC_01381]MCX4673592.1 DUF3846 domain-containing protein [Streptomyces sp. NBC_01381]
MPNNSFAVLIRTDGQFRVIDWPATSDDHDKILYTAIDCIRYDAVRITEALTMWVDDEGMFNGSRVNRSALRLYALHKPPHQPYHGHAVFTGGTDRHGNSLGLTSDEAAHLIELHLTARRIPEQRTAN